MKFSIHHTDMSTLLPKIKGTPGDIFRRHSISGEDDGFPQGHLLVHRAAEKLILWRHRKRYREYRDSSASISAIFSPAISSASREALIY